MEITTSRSHGWLFLVFTSSTSMTRASQRRSQILFASKSKVEYICIRKKKIKKTLKSGPLIPHWHSGWRSSEQRLCLRRQSRWKGSTVNSLVSNAKLQWDRSGMLMSHESKSEGNWIKHCFASLLDYYVARNSCMPEVMQFFLHCWVIYYCPAAFPYVKCTCSIVPVPCCEAPDKLCRLNFVYHHGRGL